MYRISSTLEETANFKKSALKLISDTCVSHDKKHQQVGENDNSASRYKQNRGVDATASTPRSI